MAKPSVRLERRGDAALLLLLSRAWSSVGSREIDALAHECEIVRDDASIRAVILTGEGETFCGDWSRTVEARRAQGNGLCCAAFQPLADLPQPVLAAVNGPAHGAGLELALAADLRISSSSATFLLAGGESVPLAGGLTRLSRAIGRGAATWMALTGERLTAEQALAAGLVSAVLPMAELLPEAERLTAVIASRGPIAMRFAKEALRHGPDLTLAQALRYETDLTVILQTTADRAEGVAAFAEKRPPHFTGR
ncbi:MAG: enoyl-CoA hydratase/isomerase family protein [Dehalococcoidia bacterium]